MKNTIGNAISVTLFGESHGEAIGAVVDGLAPGIKVDFEYIEKKMAKRKAGGKFTTARHEADKVSFISGVFEGYTTGTPLTVIIENGDKKSGDYKALADIPRPSHADLTAEYKYRGYQDYRGGGHFSGRITAPLVAVGALIEAALLKKGIIIGTRVKALGGVYDEGEIINKEQLLELADMELPVLSASAGEGMTQALSAAAERGDSVGGILETVIFGVPGGVGEPWFDSVESVLSHLAFSVPAVKGVEFGRGFAISDMLGSEANDAYTVRDGKIITKANNNGGIIGGITNGMPIIMRVAMKPTPSIYKEQESVRLSDMTEVPLKIEGRHDATVVKRARVVLDAVAAIGIADLLTERFGTDYLYTKE